MTGDGGEPYWTPERVRYWLAHYHELRAWARPSGGAVPPGRRRIRREPFPFEAVRLLADLDAALGILERYYPREHALVAKVYLDGDGTWQRKPLGERIRLVATDDDASERTAYRRLRDAYRRIAEILEPTLALRNLDELVSRSVE
ncbi:MAG: hypothetical protein NZ761_06210 [Dehalococcoidia bacterium]|nr:hypothetical protein [Dehalococcoidia bacterium]